MMKKSRFSLDFLSIFVSNYILLKSQYSKSLIKQKTQRKLIEIYPMYVEANCKQKI